MNPRALLTAVLLLVVAATGFSTELAWQAKTGEKLQTADVKSQVPDFKRLTESVFRVEAGESVGTGFLFLKSDVVGTCYHVIKGAAQIIASGSNDARWNVVSVPVLPKAAGGA